MANPSLRVAELKAVRAVKAGLKRIDAEQERFILQYLEECLRGIHPGKLTWKAIESFTGFSRQALSAKPDIATAYERVKLGQRSKSTRKPAKTADERNARLNGEIDRLRSILDAFDERFARIAYHCSVRGIGLDELEQPLPTVYRARPRSGGKGKAHHW
jgi:hypothetical protein